MLTVYMTKGLPASGKTEWARKKLEELGSGKATRVNKDDLRAMMHTGWSEWNEKEILATRDGIIHYALNAGRHVIVDDTNLAPKHLVAVESIAKQHAARVEVVDFTHVPVEECIRRDQNRPNYVGEKVIRKMWKRYISPPLQSPLPIPHDPAKCDAIIIDVDGTVALMNGRSPYDYTKVSTDVRNEPIVRILRIIDAYRLASFSGSRPICFLFVSGRDGSCYDETDQWLCKELFGMFRPFELFMRKPGDTRDDTIIKREIYEKHIKPNYNVLFVMDDRDKVVRMWRDQGLTCLQVADGDF